MVPETISPRSFKPSTVAVQPELLVSSVLHLMSHYTAHTDKPGCTKLAAVIERHLDALAGLPELTPVLRATCRQLAAQWADLVERPTQPPEKPHRFLRFIASSR